MVNKGSVFISYSSKDMEFVNQITEELEQMGVSYWKAPEMIPAGSSYAREIPQAIQNCNVFLLVLSATSQASIWVEKEIDSAICNRKVIIPFRIEEVTLNDTFRFYLNNVQTISYPENPQKAFLDLKQQLCQMIPGLNNEQDVKQRKMVPAADRDRSNDIKADQMDDASTAMIQNNKAVSVDMHDERDSQKRVLGVEPGLSGSRSGKHNRNSNALRINRIPLACQYCGCKELRNVSVGIYRCERCGRDNYDDFQTIRNYLEKTGAASALVIERDTGVPRRIIEYFFRDEYLEIPKNSPVRISCERCGAPIRTGTLCDECKAGLKKSSKNDLKGSWHSLW